MGHGTRWVLFFTGPGLLFKFQRQNHEQQLRHFKTNLADARANATPVRENPPTGVTSLRGIEYIRKAFDPFPCPLARFVVVLFSYVPCCALLMERLPLRNSTNIVHIEVTCLPSEKWSAQA